MNLKDLLDYHTRCISCGSALETKSPDLADVNFTRTNDGLLMETGTKDKNYSVYFKFDGTYEKMKRYNKLYVKPLSVLKECPKCLPFITMDTSEPVLWKSRSFGATTLNQIKDKRFAYKFSLFGDSQGNFDGELDWEDIKVNDGKKFYHINTNWAKKTSSLMSGDFEKDSISTIFSMSVPSVNTARIQSIEALVNKLKLYNLFS